MSMIQSPRFGRDQRVSLARARSENGGRDRSGARGLDRYPLPVIIRAIMVLSALSPLAFAILPLVVEAQGLVQRYSIISSEPSVPETGWPEGRLVHCACYSRDDLIAVFRVNGEKPISEQLDQDSDFDGTFWLIDVGSRGYYQVAVRFYRD